MAGLKNHKWLQTPFFFQSDHWYKPWRFRETIRSHSEGWWTQGGVVSVAVGKAGVVRARLGLAGGNPQPTPYALHSKPCTLHPTPYTLHPTPFTLHPTPYTLDASSTLSSEP